MIFIAWRATTQQVSYPALTYSSAHIKHFERMLECLYELARYDYKRRACWNQL